MGGGGWLYVQQQILSNVSEHQGQWGMRNWKESILTLCVLETGVQLFVLVTKKKKKKSLTLLSDSLKYVMVYVGNFCQLQINLPAQINTCRSRNVSKHRHVDSPRFTYLKI
jgi:hypothetical protein